MRKNNTDDTLFDQLLDNFIEQEFSNNPFEQSSISFECNADMPQPKPIGVNRCKPIYYNSSAVSVSLCLSRSLTADDSITVK